MSNIPTRITILVGIVVTLCGIMILLSPPAGKCTRKPVLYELSRLLGGAAVSVVGFFLISPLLTTGFQV